MGIPALNAVASVTAVALLLAAVPAMGHAAPPPASYETRILHDHNDDAAVVNAGKHAFDTIALDLREAWYQNGSHLVFRYILNGGCDADLPDPCPTLRLVTTFSSGSGHSFEIRAPDDRNVWEGEAARFVGPLDVNDGTRFAIEAWVPFGQFGLAPGSQLSDFFVTGYSGEEEADSMPRGAVPGTPDPLGAAYDIGTYHVREPTFYIGLSTGPEPVEVGGSKTFTLKNHLVANQNVTLTIDGEATFADGSRTMDTELPALFAKDIEVLVQGGSGALELQATTLFGGIANASVWVLEKKMQEGTIMSPDLAQGGSWTHEFKQAGNFSYHDHHSGAVGTVVVRAETGSNAHNVTFDGTFLPAFLEVRAGDTVTWTNQADRLLVMGSFDAVHGHDGNSEHVHGTPVGLVALLGLLLTLMIDARRPSNRWRRR